MPGKQKAVVPFEFQDEASRETSERTDSIRFVDDCNDEFASVLLVVANFRKSWRKLIHWAQSVTIWNILGHPQGATRCEHFINSQEKGATVCMSGSNIYMFFNAFRPK